MQQVRNMPEPFEAIKTSLQARAILDILDQESCTNGRLLAEWLRTIGLGISSRALGDILDRMEWENLLHSEMVENVRVVHLHQLGREVASGCETADWIARRELAR